MRTIITRKVNINLLKEIGYIILLTVFFIGILIGSISFKNVSESNFNEYKISLQENINKLTDVQKDIIAKNNFIEAIKVVVLFWIIGMSVVGIIVLVGYVGFKGYSLGYTISAILKLFGVSKGNEYIFQNLFLKNVFLVFIMIFMANYSLKITKTFFVNKQNLKIDTFKYTAISVLICIILSLSYLLILLF